MGVGDGHVVCGGGARLSGAIASRRPRPLTDDEAAFLGSTALLAGLDAAAVSALMARVEAVTLEAGEHLFEAGDEVDGVYVVLQGRLDVVRPGDGRAAPRWAVVNHVAAGEMVGETGLLASEPRTATVVALRRTTVARLTTSDFHLVVEHEPRAALAVGSVVAGRLARATVAAPAVGRPVVPTSVAIVAATAGVDVAALVQSLVATIARHRVVRPVTIRDAPTAAALAPIVDDADRSAAVLLVQVPDPSSDWAAMVMGYVDSVLLVVDADAPRSLSAAARLIARGRPHAPRAELVLVHPSWRARPSGTRRWLAVADFAGHHHVRSGRVADLERLGRHVAGRSVGLVLGGGGAKGFAHLGAIAAWREAGLPLDRLGGSSMGGVIACQVAMGLDDEALLEMNRMWAARHITLRLTVPVVSVLSSTSAEKMFAEMFGDLDLEDLWLPCFVTAVNLSRLELLAPDRGRVKQWARATASPPGMLPPMVIGGELVVDGGVLDNVPVVPMRAAGAGVVAAVNVSPPSDLQVVLDRAPAPWRVMVGALRGRPTAFPSIVRLLHRTAMVTSMHAQAIARASADLFVEPDLRDMGFADMRRLEAIAARGRAAMSEMLATRAPDVRRWQ